MARRSSMQSLTIWMRNENMLSHAKSTFVCVYVVCMLGRNVHDLEMTKETCREGK